MYPKDKVYTDDELSKTFKDYKFVSSFRLPEVPNTWCLWGEIEEPVDIEFNRICSDMVDYDVYSHIILIHDSEIDPSWNLTDDIQYKTYPKWLEQMGEFIHEKTHIIAEENARDIEASESINPTSMIFLTTMGYTEDKRVLLSFNPTEQNDNFYIDGGWEQLSQKIYDYVRENFDKEPIEENKPFVIFADTKTIVIIENKHIDEVIDRMIESFKDKEKYENCKYLGELKKEWKKRKPPLESKNSDKKQDDPKK